MFTGTVHITNMYDRAKELIPDMADTFKSSKDTKLVVLDFDSPTTVKGRLSGDMGRMGSRENGESIALENDGSWSSYDGKKITVAVHPADMWFPSDVAGALYTATSKNVVVIAPLTKETAVTAVRDAGELTRETRDAIAEAEPDAAEL